MLPLMFRIASSTIITIRAASAWLCRVNQGHIRMVHRQTLGFQAGGGPQAAEIIRVINEPSYKAAGKAQSLGGVFRESAAVTRQPKKILNDFKRMR